MPNMDKDLESIASLEFSKAVERIRNEARRKMETDVAVLPRGGAREHRILASELDQSEQTIRAYAQIWQDLLEARNGGHLTHENVNFILHKVRTIVAAGWHYQFDHQRHI
jgi:hypothetical protein